MRLETERYFYWRSAVPALAQGVLYGGFVGAIPLLLASGSIATNRLFKWLNTPGGTWTCLLAGAGTGTLISLYAKAWGFRYRLTPDSAKSFLLEEAKDPSKFTRQMASILQNSRTWHVSIHLVPKRHPNERDEIDKPFIHLRSTLNRQNNRHTTEAFAVQHGIHHLPLPLKKLDALKSLYEKHLPKEPLINSGGADFARSRSPEKGEHEAHNL